MLRAIMAAGVLALGCGRTIGYQDGPCADAEVYTGRCASNFAEVCEPAPKGPHWRIIDDCSLDGRACFLAAHCSGGVPCCRK